MRMKSKPAGPGTRRRRPWQEEQSFSKDRISHHAGKVDSSSDPDAPPIRTATAAFGNNNAGSSFLPIIDRLYLSDFFATVHKDSKHSDSSGTHKIMGNRETWHTVRKRLNHWTSKMLCASTIFLMGLTTHHHHTYNNKQVGALLRRPTMDYAITTSNSDGLIPLLIPFLASDDDDDTTNNGNLGGWIAGSGRRLMHPQYYYSQVDDIDVSAGELVNEGLADFGGLVFLSLSQQNFQRQIRDNDNLLYHHEKETQVESMNQEYISKRHWFKDELEDYDFECKRTSWVDLHFPTCNSFHEVDLSRPYDAFLAARSGDWQDGESTYLSHGYFRDVFALNQHSAHSKAVLKVARYKRHEINYRSMFNARRDALIMERLTSAPNIVSIYGHCGSSVMVESLPHEVEEFIVPGGGWMKHEDLNDSKDVDIQNNFTVAEKLSIALEMAESIAELHGFKDGVIAHDDIQLCQWLRNDEGKLKLGDFNRARVLEWNEEKQEYCKYENGRGYGNYRAPEEYAEKGLSMQHDVWSMGNNIYALLTGLWVFYDNEDDEVVAEKVVNHTLAFIDDRYRKRSYAEGRFVEIMERCWEYNMDKRVSIFQVVDFLRETQRVFQKESQKGSNA